MEELVSDLLVSRPFPSCLIFLPALQGKATVAPSSDALSQQSDAAGSAQALNTKRVSKADLRGKQIEQAAEAAPADERCNLLKSQTQSQGQWQGGSRGTARSVGRGAGPIPMLLLEIGYVGRTPASCTTTEPHEIICVANNFPDCCPNALPGLLCGRVVHVCAKSFQRHPAHGNR